MSIGKFLKQCLMQFFIISTCVTLATAVVGPYLLPNFKVGFDTFYSPIMVGIICTLPSFVFYSKQELDLRHTIYRRIIHMVIIAGGLTVLNWYVGNFVSLSYIPAYIMTVFVIYVIVILISWILESRDAKLINEQLNRLQNSK